MRIQSVPSIKLIRSALLRYDAILQHNNLVCTCHGTHPVSDDENGLVFDEAGQSLLNRRFVLNIQTCGGLVQQNDGRILQKSTGDGNALTLTAGKSAAILADIGVPLVRQLLGKFLAVCQLCRRKDLLVGGTFAPQTDVFEDCVVKQGHILKDDGIQAHEFFRVDSGDIHAAHGDTALLVIPEPCCQPGNSGLAAAGGAPANLAVAASRLGAQTAFIGKVGADAFGRYLKEVLAENKVDVSGMAVDADHPTTMAVVSVDATGERDFSFYRSANADVMLCNEDISEGALKAAKIVHFGSVSLTADPSRTATLDAAARAKKLGAVITYDPNYRANLWKNKEDAIAQMKAPLPLVDILKVSDEELPLLTGTTDCESGTAQLAQNGIRLIFVTLGANGVFYRFGDKTGHVAGVPCKVGDTNGAGDTFFGAALSKLCKEELDTLTVDKLEGILAFANKAASITTSRHGAIPAMPTLAEVEG